MIHIQCHNTNYMTVQNEKKKEQVSLEGTMTGFRKYWLSSMSITLGSVQITSSNHSMQVKEMMSLCHGTHNVFKSSQPCECLFPSLCIK